ncbi:hypothetical protein LEQ_2019 [Ligilactobacillus equi DPC 6820]|uniref:Calcineurin-like phosphoesterase domain-containing protein n=2 Tax=Ligilactobacillus equi TaxID=137357 RepID=V7HYV7_9LACO|nr:hypothetical protein LEQ_2019 [Ligilactobacillus equi DPC 6820]
MHWALDNGTWSSTSQEVDKLVDAINRGDTSITLENYGTFDLSGVVGKIPVILSGHEHQDNAKTLSSGVSHVVTTCDAGRLQYHEETTYVKGTTSEQALDVFIIDFDKKEIDDLRIGRGSDRKFNF